MSHAKRMRQQPLQDKVGYNELLSAMDEGFVRLLRVQSISAAAPYRKELASSD
jgi:hypothetical protein